MKSDISVTCVGDNKQATFKTNNSIKNKKMTGTNIWMFFEKMVNEGIAEIKKNLVRKDLMGKYVILRMKFIQTKIICLLQC